MTNDEQVDVILTMMLRGEWHGGSSRKKLAAEWGIKERTVGDRAVIASGVAARVGKPIEQEVASKLAELEAIQTMAMEHCRPIHVKDSDGTSHVEYAPEPQFRDAIAAIKLQMDIRGVTTRRPKEEAKPIDDEWARMTALERIAKLDEAKAEELAKLEQQKQELQ